MKVVPASQMKRVLLIAYYFPPDFAVGGQRIAKFARNLPTFGWEPTVLTIDDRYRDQLDMERMKELGNVQVLKTLKVPNMTGFLLKIKMYFSSKLRSRKSEDSAEYVDHYGDNSGQIQSESLLQMLKRFYISFSCFPDSERSWVIPATLKALIEIKKRHLDCILTSSPPHSSHLIGLILKKLLNIKWVADFRDPWIDILQNKTPRIRTILTDKIEAWIENQVVLNADKVITTTDEHRKTIESRYGAESDNKFIYIPNGFDTLKFSNSGLPARYEKFTISYAGTIYLNRSPEPLFKAIHKLITSKRVNSSEINFKLFGNCEQIDGKSISSIINAYNLDEVVEVLGPIPLNDAIHTMQRSHLLLLLVTSIQSINIPAKIYDYFGSGTKILAITESGATAELIKATRSGVCFAPNDTDEVAEYIYNQCRTENRDHLRNDANLYRQFDTQVLTEKLANVLSSL